jgi:hypothetical protein
MPKLSASLKAKAAPPLPVPAAFDADDDEDTARERADYTASKCLLSRAFQAETVCVSLRTCAG